MIDPNIITRGAEMAQRQQQQNMQSLGELGGNLGQLVLGRRINQMQQLDSPEAKQAFASNSIFAPMLNRQIKSDNAAAAQSAMALQKHEADIYSTKGKGAKDFADAGKASQETAVNRQRAISSAMAAAMSGSPQAANFMLEHGKSGGILDENSYAQAKQFLAKNANNPQAIGSLVQSLGVAAAEKPEQYIQPDANTVAGNQTSIKTTSMNNKTSEYIADSNAATAAAKLEQDGEQFDAKLEQDKIIREQEIAFKNGEFETMQGEGGVTYAVYKSGPNAGKIEPLRIEGGDVFKQQSKTKLDSSALKQVNEYNAQLTQSKASQVKIGGLLKDLQSGRLNLSPQAILAAEGRARIGQSTPNDLAIGRFNTMLNQAVNDVLMAAKGTQTDGDAQRAAQVIRANPPRDNAAALQALQNLALITKTNIAALDTNLNTTYANFGMERPQVKAQTPKPPASTEQEAPTPKGSVVSLAKVKQLAQQAGISTEEAAKRFQSQGLVIK